jgi:hypothetical protein
VGDGREKMKIRQVIRDTRELLKDARQARRGDDVIDEKEAAELVEDALKLASTVIGEVKLSASAKELLRALAAETLRRLEE